MSESSNPILLANALLAYACTVAPEDRLRTLARFIPIDLLEEPSQCKAQQKRLNNLLMNVLKLRDQIAVELQVEAWNLREVQQLSLWQSVRQEQETADGL